MLLLSEVQTSSIQNVARSSVTGQAFLTQLDEAIRNLARRGDWVGTVVPMAFCIQRGYIVLPRFVDHIRKVAVRGRQLPLHNIFWDFISAKAREYNGWDWQERMNAVNQGRTCTYNDVPGPGWSIRAYCEKSQDFGKTVTIYGLDNNNQPLMTLNPGNVWTEGIVLTLGNPYFDTAPQQVQKIHRVVKETTQGRVRLYAAFVNTGLATANIGYVWNIDTNSPVALTAQGLLGFQYLALGAGSPPPGTANIGYLYNLQLNQWQGIVARGQPGSYYLQIGQAGPVGVGGVQVYNSQIASMEPIVLYGQVGAEYVGIGGASAPVNMGTTMLDLAMYEPSETNPSYERLQVHLPHFVIPKPTSVPQGCCQQLSAVCLVKLKHIKAVNPNDPIIIDNIEALKLAVQAIQYGEDGDRESRDEFFQDAVTELNRQLQDEQPETEIPVETGDLNGGMWGHQKVY